MDDSLPFVDAATLEKALPPAAALQVLREGFAAAPRHLLRSHSTFGSAEFLAMPAVTPTAAGIKLITVQPNNVGTDRPIIQGLYALFSEDDGRPVALFEGAALTNLRTPLISALATHELARPNVGTVGVVGSGPQAESHVHAMRLVRPSLHHVVIAGRTPSNVDALVCKLRSAGIDAVAGSYADAAACDIVCTCTRSSDPLIDLPDVSPGAHLNLVGSYRLDLREVTAAIVAASMVTVDDRQAARAEAGDLAMAVEEGAWNWSSIAGDLVDLSNGRVGRSSDSRLTLFKSVGLAVQDLLVATAAARQLGYL